MEVEQTPDEQLQTEAVAEVQKDEISRTESTVRTLVTFGTDSALPGQNMTVSAVSVRTSTAAAQAPAKVVKVLIGYPDKWKRPKHLVNGQTYTVSPETADQFIKEGFATLVKEDQS